MRSAVTRLGLTVTQLSKEQLAEIARSLPRLVPSRSDILGGYTTDLANMATAAWE
jgi:hypothetical protein